MLRSRPTVLYQAKTQAPELITNDRYLVATGNWTGNVWSYTDGGAANAPAPTSANRVFITASSGAATVTLTAAAECGSLTTTGASGATIAKGTNTLSVYGDVTLTSGVSLTGTGALVLAGTGSHTFTHGGASTAANTLQLNSVGGTYTVQDGGNWDMYVTITRGNWDYNGQTITHKALTSTGSLTRSITANGAVVTLHSIASNRVIWFEATGLTFTHDTGEFIVTSNSNPSHWIDGAGVTFNKITHNTTADLALRDACTYAEVALSGSGRNLLLGTSVTQTFTAGGNGITSSGSGNIIQSTSGTATLTKSGGTVSISNTQVKNLTATGGATWNSFIANGNRDMGGNTGWNFAGAVSDIWARLPEPPAMTVPRAIFFATALAASGPIEPPVHETLPEEITADKWFNHLSEPLNVGDDRVARGHRIAEMSSGAFTPPPLAILPPSGRVEVTWTQVCAGIGEATTADRWFVPLSEPVRVRPPLPTAAQQFSVIDAAFTPPAETIEADKWFVPWTDPPAYLVKLGLSAAAQQYAVVDSESLTQPETVTVDRWLLPLSEPSAFLQPRGLGVESQPSATIDTEILTQPETVFVDKWFAYLSEPPPPKPGLAAEQQIAWAGPSVVPVETIVPADWFVPLSEPTLPKASLGAESQQAFTIDPDGLTQPEAVTVDRWLISLSEPAAYLKLRGLEAALQRPFTIDPVILTQREAVTVDRWLVPLSEPVRVAVPLVPEGFFTPEFDENGQQEQIFADKWFVLWREPPPPLAGLHASQQQFSVTDPEGLTQPESVTVDRWLIAWSEPVRVRAPLSDLGGQSFELSATLVPEIITVDKWFAPLSNPVPPKAALAAANQQFSIVDAEALTQPETVTVDRWLQPLSEPVRVRAPLVDFGGRSYEIGADLVGEIITADKWLRPFVEVPRAVPALDAALQSTTTVDSEILTQPEQTFADSWFAWLSQPLYAKAGLGSALQATLGESLEPIAAPAVPDLGWFTPLAEPYFDEIQFNEYGFAAYATISPPSIVGEYCPFPVFVPMYDFPVAVTGDMEDTAVAVVAPMTDQLPITNPDHQGEAVSADLGPDQVIVVVELC